MVVVCHYIHSVLMSRTDLDKDLESVWELLGDSDTDMF